MMRKIVKIDPTKCTGCGLCADACHEGAIEMRGGVAVLVRDDYCDGLGACLPACPADAITIEEREAAPFDEAAVKQRLASREGSGAHEHHAHDGGTLACGCPGATVRAIERGERRGALPAGHIARAFGPGERRGALPAGEIAQALDTGELLAALTAGVLRDEPCSCLSQWPVQMKLVPTGAPYFDGAKLLVAADCTAYAYGNFHERFIRGRVTLVGCPKLDGEDYSHKLAEIIRTHDIKNVTVVRMEVPCCAGIVEMVRQGLIASGKMLPWQAVTVSCDGEIADD